MQLKANGQKRGHDRLRETSSVGRRPSGEPGGEFAVPDARLSERQPHSARQPYRPRHLEGPSDRPERKRDELPLWVKGPLEQDHGGDPEQAWKIRERELLRWYEEGGEARPGAGAKPPPGLTGGYGKGRGPGSGRPFGRVLLLQTLAALLLFAGAAGLDRFHTSWAAEAKRQIRWALTYDMNFDRAAAWYSRTFDGAPSFLPAFGIKSNAAKVHAPVASTRFVQPVKGKAKQPFTASAKGIWLETRKAAHVAAMDDGRIEFAGERTDTGYTLVIQHAEGYSVTYGGLQPARWEPGDWVKAGDVIGSAGGEGEQGTVYLAVKKDQRYVDPMDVVAFD